MDAECSLYLSKKCQQPRCGKIVKIETNLAVLAFPDKVGLTPAAGHLVLFLDEFVGERKDRTIEE
jgi:hypothetical protein